MLLLVVIIVKNAIKSIRAVQMSSDQLINYLFIAPISQLDLFPYVIYYLRHKSVTLGYFLASAIAEKCPIC